MLLKQEIHEGQCLITAESQDLIDEIEEVSHNDPKKDKSGLKTSNSLERLAPLKHGISIQRQSKANKQQNNPKNTVLTPLP